MQSKNKNTYIYGERQQQHHHQQHNITTNMNKKSNLQRLNSASSTDDKTMN